MRVSREQARENRQRVVSLSSELFREKGMDGVAINDVMSEAGLLDMTERVSGASPREVQRFFARGMLCNVSAAMQIYELDQHWAQVLVGADAEGSTA